MAGIHNSRRLRHGYTLVELVIIVLLIGVIAAIVAPKLFDTADDARDSSARQTLSVVRNAITLCRATTGQYPGDGATSGDFKNDLKPFLATGVPDCPVGNLNGAVKVETAGVPLTAGGTQGWKYDNQTGEFIINAAGYDSF